MIIWGVCIPEGLIDRLYKKVSVIMANKKAKTAPKKGGNEAKKKSSISKSHIIISVLASFAFSFSFFIVGPLSFFFSEANRGYFEDNNIYAASIVPLMVIAAAIFFVILAAILILATGKIHTVLVSVITWLLVCGYVQTLFFNGWTNGLIGDGNAGNEMPAFGIPNLLLWIALGVLIIGAPLAKGKLKKVAGIAKMVVVYLLVLVFAMQGAGLLEVILNAPEQKETAAFLSTENMFDVSTNDNVIVLILDRFDQLYYDAVVADDPNFFADFDGFTAYTDNIALYARTYPAVTSMLTGVENDFSTTRTEYFDRAYSNSTFINDMVSGGYDVNIYSSNWFVYDDANKMGDIANAIDAGDSATLNNPMGLLSAMISYSVYNFGPDIVKPLMGVSTRIFAGYASQDTDYEMYAIDDAKVFARFEREGVQQKNKDNFTFLHLRGCHSPYNVDENGYNVGDGNSTLVKQTTGVFKFVREYIAELKAMGVYENATIIITGDHANPVSDHDDVAAPRLTALLVKEKGQYGTEFKESSAPVSQENLIPTIIKSSGVKPSVEYGRAYSEIGEDEILTRKYLFEKSVDSKEKDQIVEYEITGPAKEYANWKIKERHEIGYIYK